MRPPSREDRVCAQRKVAHLCEVSPGRGSGAQPDAAGTRSWPHDSCTSSPRSHSPQISPLTGSKKGHDKSSRVGIVLGTLPHLTAGIVEADRLPWSYSGLWKSADMESNWSSDDEFKHHRHSHHWLGRSCALVLGGSSSGHRESAAGWSLSVPRSTLCSGRLSACLIPKRTLPPFLFTSATVCAPNEALCIISPHVTPPS